MVNFYLEKVHGALVTLHDAQSRPLAVSSSVQVSDEAAQLVGYDGKVYLRRLQPTNRLMVTQLDGSVCTAHLEYLAVSSDIPLIGVVPCL